MVCVNASNDILQDGSPFRQRLNTMSFYPAPIDRCNKLSDSIVIAHFPLNALHYAPEVWNTQSFVYGCNNCRGDSASKVVFFSPKESWFIKSFCKIVVLRLKSRRKPALECITMYLVRNFTKVCFVQRTVKNFAFCEIIKCYKFEKQTNFLWFKRLQIKLI